MLPTFDSSVLLGFSNFFSNSLERLCSPPTKTTFLSPWNSNTSLEMSFPLVNNIGAWRFFARGVDAKASAKTLPDANTAVSKLPNSLAICIEVSYLSLPEILFPKVSFIEFTPPKV